MLIFCLSGWHRHGRLLLVHSLGGVLGTVGCCEVQWELKPVLLWDRHLQSLITFRGINPCWKIFVAGWRAVIDSTCAVISLATVLHFVLQTFTLTHDYRLNSGNRENHESFSRQKMPHTQKILHNLSWLDSEQIKSVVVMHNLSPDQHILTGCCCTGRSAISRSGLFHSYFQRRSAVEHVMVTRFLCFHVGFAMLSTERVSSQ